MARSATSAVEKTEYFTLLGRARDPALAQRALSLALTDEPEKTTAPSIVGATAGAFLDMFGDEGVLECPFAPQGALRRLSGKEAIRGYYKRLTAVQASDGMVLTASYSAEDGPDALLEYEGMVRNKRDGGTYRQRYLAVVTASHGRIALFREYWNPLPLVASFGSKGPLPLH